MKKVIVCNCNPGISHQIVSTDAKLLRRVRKDSLERAARWDKGLGTDLAVICARYTAHLCLMKMRELR